MAILTIRNLPEELHALLKERARKNRRSLNQEVIAELAAASEKPTEAARTAAARQRMQRAIEGVNELRKGMTRFLRAEEIDAAIEEGRR